MRPPFRTRDGSRSPYALGEHDPGQQQVERWLAWPGRSLGELSPGDFSLSRAVVVPKRIRVVSKRIHLLRLYFHPLKHLAAVTASKEKAHAFHSKAPCAIKLGSGESLQNAAGNVGTSEEPSCERFNRYQPLSRLRPSFRISAVRSCGLRTKSAVAILRARRFPNASPDGVLFAPAVHTTTTPGPTPGVFTFHTRPWNAELRHRLRHSLTCTEARV